jgi:hypothetical protein
LNLNIFKGIVRKFRSWTPQARNSENYIFGLVGVWLRLESIQPLLLDSWPLMASWVQLPINLNFRRARHFLVNINPTTKPSADKQFRIMVFLSDSAVNPMYIPEGRTTSQVKQTGWKYTSRYAAGPFSGWGHTAWLNLKFDNKPRQPKNCGVFVFFWIFSISRCTCTWYCYAFHYCHPIAKGLQKTMGRYAAVNGPLMLV